MDEANAARRAARLPMLFIADKGKAFHAAWTARKRQAGVEGAPSGSYDGPVVQATPKSGKKRQSCHNCRKSEHKATECTEPCRNCNSADHQVFECPRN